MASNLATFRALLVKHADDGKKLPSVVLADNNDLGQAFARVVSSEQPNEGETPGATTGRYLDEICTSLGQEENRPAVTAFEETVSLFTTKIRNAWDNVSAIRDTGRELAAEMEKIYSDQLTKNEFVSKHLNYSNLKTDFPIFGWDGTKTMGSMSDVIKEVNALVTADKENVSSEINASLFNILTSDMTKFGQVEDVPMQEGLRESAIDALANVCQGIPTGDIENVVDAVTGINKNCPVHAALSSLKDLATAQVNLFKNVKLFDGAITSFYPVLDVIISEQVAPIPSSKELVIANAKKIVTVLQIAAYYEYMLRTTTFRESVLLQGGMVNSDVQDAFKEAGGTSQMLAEFIRFMYNDNVDAIPVSGIKIKPIVDGATNIAERVKNDIANVASRVAIAKNTARTTAYRIVMRDHLSKKFKRDDENATTIATKVEEAMKAHILPIVDSIKQFGVNFVDATMKGIVATEYKGTFTEHLFNELGVAYVAATEQSGNITAADLRQADVSVIAKLICTFLADNLVVVVPEGTDAPVVQDT